MLQDVVFQAAWGLTMLPPVTQAGVGTRGSDWFGMETCFFCQQDNYKREGKQSVLSNGRLLFKQTIRNTPSSLCPRRHRRYHPSPAVGTGDICRNPTAQSRGSA